LLPTGSSRISTVIQNGCAARKSSIRCTRATHARADERSADHARVEKRAARTDHRPGEPEQRAEPTAERVPPRKLTTCRGSATAVARPATQRYRGLAADPLPRTLVVDPVLAEHFAERSALDRPADGDERGEQRKPETEHARLHGAAARSLGRRMRPPQPHHAEQSRRCRPRARSSTP
jgi:hypothetical protein